MFDPGIYQVPSQDELLRIQFLCDSMQYLTAYELSESLADFSAWQTPKARLLAARIVHQLGDHARSQRLELAAYRHFPEDVAIRTSMSYRVARHRGPIEALKFLSALAPSLSDSCDLQVDYCLAKSLMLIALRDFQAAQELAIRVELLAPGSPDAAYLKSSVLAARDRRSEALDLCQASRATSAEPGSA